MTSISLDDELRQIIAFYETPVGMKTITVMPQLMAEIMANSQELPANGSAVRVWPKSLTSTRTSSRRWIKPNKKPESRNKECRYNDLPDAALLL